MTSDVPRLSWAGARTLIGALRGDGLRLRAMALTYISLFAVVPALVVVFSVVQAFTGMDRISWRGHLADFVHRLAAFA